MLQLPLLATIPQLSMDFEISFKCNDCPWRRQVLKPQHSHHRRLTGVQVAKLHCISSLWGGSALQEYLYCHLLFQSGTSKWPHYKSDCSILEIMASGTSKALGDNYHFMGKSKEKPLPSKGKKQLTAVMKKPNWITQLLSLWEHKISCSHFPWGISHTFWDRLCA